MERYFMNYKDFSKYLSYLLRHNPRDIKLNMNEQGWVDIDELIVNLKKYKGKDTNYEEIKEIVDTDKKGRYSILDGKIRANQGHSLDFVKIAFKEYKEEKILYHGTSKENYDKILNSGSIKSMTRQYVHLSKDKEVAKKVGKRHSHKEEPVIIEIDTKRMLADGIKLYESENGVILTKEVNKKYFL